MFVLSFYTIDTHTFCFVVTVCCSLDEGNCEMVKKTIFDFIHGTNASDREETDKQNVTYLLLFFYCTIFVFLHILDALCLMLLNSTSAV